MKSINNLKNLKYVIKHYSFLVFVTNVEVKINKYFERKSFKTLKILGLMTDIEEYQKIYNHA